MAEPRPRRVRVIREDRSTRIVEIDWDLFLDSDSRPISVSGFVRDVTEIELRDRALTESEERFRTLCDQNIDGVVLLRAGKIVYANHVWIEPSGHSPDEIEGHSPMEFVAPEERDLLDARLKAVERGEAQPPAVVHAFKKNGEPIIVETRSRLVRISGEQAILTVVRDISSLTSREEELEGTLEKLASF